MRIPNGRYSGKKAKGQLLLARTTIPRTKGVRLHTTANANTNTLIYGSQAQSKKKKSLKYEVILLYWNHSSWKRLSISYASSARESHFFLVIQWRQRVSRWKTSGSAKRPSCDVYSTTSCYFRRGVPGRRLKSFALFWYVCRSGIFSSFPSFLPEQWRKRLHQVLNVEWIYILHKTGSIRVHPNIVKIHVENIFKN